jgi:hypothetical protein
MPPCQQGQADIKTDQQKKWASAHLLLSHQARSHITRTTALPSIMAQADLSMIYHICDSRQVAFN